MAWPFDTPEYSFPRPSGIDTVMNYQDQIRTLPGGNYQNWQDLIIDPVRQENLAESDFNRLYNMGAYDDEGTGQREINYKDAPVPFSGFFTGDRRLHPNNPLLGLASLFQRPEAKQRAYESIMDTGTYKGNPYALYDTRSGLKVGSDILGYGQGYAKNFDSAFGSKSLEDMEQKKVDWALGRLDKFKDDEENLGISKRLYNALIKRGVIDSSGNRITTPAGTDTITDIITDNITTGGSTTPNVHGGGSEASFTQRSPGGISQATSRAARTDQSGNVMSGWNLAQGGRAGYRDGELVDEDVNIAGPGFDVNENIEMASAPDPMDALNDFALEIFGKPLDMLNDEERGILYDLANEQAAIGEEQGIASLV
jgi:hypothetical protein